MGSSSGAVARASARLLRSDVARVGRERHRPTGDVGAVLPERRGDVSRNHRVLPPDRLEGGERVLEPVLTDLPCPVGERPHAIPMAHDGARGILTLSEGDPLEVSVMEVLDRVLELEDKVPAARVDGDPLIAAKALEAGDTSLFIPSLLAYPRRREVKPFGAEVVELPGGSIRPAAGEVRERSPSRRGTPPWPSRPRRGPAFPLRGDDLILHDELLRRSGHFLGRECIPIAGCPQSPGCPQ